jgi:hypothetical protein
MVVMIYSFKIAGGLPDHFTNVPVDELRFRMICGALCWFDWFAMEFKKAFTAAEGAVRFFRDLWLSCFR